MFGVKEMSESLRVKRSVIDLGMKLVVLDCFSSLFQAMDSAINIRQRVQSIFGGSGEGCRENLSISSTDFTICSELVSITCPPSIISSKIVCSLKEVKQEWNVKNSTKTRSY
jgi:hypothetical protein